MTISGKIYFWLSNKYQYLGIYLVYILYKYIVYLDYIYIGIREYKYQEGIWDMNIGL